MHVHGQWRFINWMKCGDFSSVLLTLPFIWKIQCQVFIYSCCVTSCKSQYVTIFCMSAETDGSADFKDRSERHWEKKATTFAKAE